MTGTHIGVNFCNNKTYIFAAVLSCHRKFLYSEVRNTNYYHCHDW